MPLFIGEVMEIVEVHPRYSSIDHGISCVIEAEMACLYPPFGRDASCVGHPPLF